MYSHRNIKDSTERKTWLYLVRHSPRQGAPALICPAAAPTARSAMKESSVSPDLCDTITPQWASFACFTTSMASVTVPTWFTCIYENVIDKLNMTRNKTGILRAPMEYGNFAGSGMFPAKTYEITVFEIGHQQNHITLREQSCNENTCASKRLWPQYAQRLQPTSLIANFSAFSKFK